ncbi:MAG: hypothetical protein Q4G52_08815 [Clostridia bacterium]|nr:hypothetical protein [Clostridia bacterium]
MKRKVGIALWAAALAICLLLADQVTRRDDSERKYGAFFSDEQGFDVLFLGTSRVLDGISPMELWRDYGITSYNMGNSSECLDVTEWVLRLALEEHTPKVAVIDVYYIGRRVDDAWTYTYRHLFLDAVPLSPLKFKAVSATLPRSSYLEFLMPFSLYHGRWEEILSGKTERLIDCEPFMMGGELRIGRTIPEAFERTADMNEQELPGTQALRRIAALCRERGIEPVFMAIPAPISRQEQMDVNGVVLVAQELGVPFVNLFDVEGLVDFETDCYDEVGHMNPDGASKITAYMGDWLVGRYALEDRRGTPGCAAWDERLAQYEAFRSEQWGEMTLLQNP